MDAGSDTAGAIILESNLPLNIISFLKTDLLSVPSGDEGSSQNG